MNFQKILASTFIYLLQYKSQLFKALLIPFIVFLLINNVQSQTDTTTARLLLLLVSILLQTLIAITISRIILLGPSSVPTWGMLQWSNRETQFLLKTFAIVLMAIPIGLLSVIPVIGVGLAIGVIFWVVSRLSLVFPSIAIDKPLTFEQSWNMTQKYQFVMLAVVIVIPLLLTLCALAIQQLGFLAILTDLITIIFLVIQVTMLSMAYQLIIDENSPTSSNDHAAPH